MNVVEHLAPDDAYDLVVVLMHKNQVSAILPTLAANRHTPNVLFMGNNAAGPDEMVEALGQERVLLGFARVGVIEKGTLSLPKLPLAAQSPSVSWMDSPRLVCGW